ncbi:4-(cytidine 5'-diphospho)-2-C-methyl-D-erythritol kinase [Gluconacetobacter entanii]|uniref:4-diphosphocytidyl-2-C-methyl-D-erythritol kinase n=1 Tax=Gluconacetobacter entanii TaxID=108528 RepID=A0A318PTI6_9PROT|nr:4-(cytidine 5'-diphospho)-2-C-methyl-D-erythritol kinase [Gluconacetobacter entanii]MCE2578559.1 4-(cytidine 5'-diphospho)-2-C-methyl-D-erythritol kinase [Komagataeibacter sp. FNDCR1]MCW4591508.1 4-(cytidine 5'-diphospho)-2-C-methyl-D-erythritol kinase [Gluconacetobacter entanii]MCW4593909.1 4-(cytidine 5'-diphospho)-2-C-methyl-D-erythritol kinase [Gluconacetobacter entanii]NPC90459.1 4-(cytidine 5'-diphospho)-2-C-methyl-D-erythritol kinase [Gluconacetobacter entanii]PYD62468.1 4-(cytidine 
MTATQSESAHAKINLYLHVTGRRADGYHLLDSVAVFAGAADVLDVEVAQARGAALGLRIDGMFGAGLRGDDATNLVIRAADALRARAGAGAQALPSLDAVLHKELPVASGIGGGSADAAAALRCVMKAWDMDVPRAELLEIATALGADVPVCLDQVPTRMSGIGEILRPAPVLPQCGMMLVNCGMSVSTPAVFRARQGGFRPAPDLPARWETLSQMVGTLSELSNDLEDAACEVCPTIREVLSALRAAPGCRFARMSGSGATCFALFDSPQAAELAQDAVARPGWWVWAGDLYRDGRAA